MQKNKLTKNFDLYEIRFLRYCLFKVISKIKIKNLFNEFFSVENFVGIVFCWLQIL